MLCSQQSAWPSRKWLIFHITMPLLKQPPPPHSAHIYCLLSIHAQQASMRVDGCHFLLIEESNSTPSPAICHMATKCNGILVGRFNLYCPSTSDVIGQYNKIGSISSGEAFICLPLHQLYHCSWLCSQCSGMTCVCLTLEPPW